MKPSRTLDENFQKKEHEELNFVLAKYVMKRFLGNWETFFINSLKETKQASLYEWARMLVGYTRNDIDNALSYITTDPNWRERAKYPPGKVEFIEVMKSRRITLISLNAEIEEAKKYLEGLRNDLYKRLLDETLEKEKRKHIIDLLQGWEGIGITSIIEDYQSQRLDKPRICSECEKYAAWFSQIVKKQFCSKHFFDKRLAGEKI